MNLSGALWHRASSASGLFPACSVMSKSSAGPGRKNTIWKLSALAPCQPATRYPPWKTSPLEPRWLPASQKAHCWPLQARKLLSIQGAKEPQGPVFAPQTLKLALPATYSGLGKKEKKGLKAQVCVFNLIASALHFAPRLKSPLSPLFGLDSF